MKIAGFDVPLDSPLFLVILAVHVPLGLAAVATGVVAMVTSKRRGAHTKFGSIYFWNLCALFVTSAGLAAMRWRHDYYLFILGAVSFTTALIGRTARRQGWSTPIDLHISGMGISYIVMLTAFYVDNGQSLPVWKTLPHFTYWLLPSAIGLPLIFRALGRYRKAIAHASRPQQNRLSRTNANEAQAESCKACPSAGEDHEVHRGYRFG